MVKDRKRDEFISDNMRLVNHLCKRFSGRGIEYEDLYQAGCVGLVKAADAFDKTRGFQFSTYAVPVILGEMRRLFRDGGSVKVSRSLKELSLKINREKSLMENESGAEPTVFQIAKRVGVSVEEVTEAMDAAKPAVSLTAASLDGENQIDVPVASGEHALDDKLMLQSAVSKLDEKERELVRLRFFEQLTQNETAKRLGLTQVGVSRAEKKILLKLRAIIGPVT